MTAAKTPAELFYSKFIDKMQKDSMFDGRSYFCIYKNKVGTTALLKKVITEIIESKNFWPDGELEAEHEYFRIDCIGFVNHKEQITEDAEEVDLNPHLWDLKIAVEYENDYKDWTDELIKLAHIRCPLKVVIGYSPWDKRGKQEEAKLLVAAKWLRKLEVYKSISSEHSEQLLIILGNRAGTTRGKSYEDFGFRGYLYSYETEEFQPLIIP